MAMRGSAAVVSPYRIPASAMASDQLRAMLEGVLDVDRLTADALRAGQDTAAAVGCC